MRNFQRSFSRLMLAALMVAMSAATVFAQAIDPGELRRMPPDAGPPPEKQRVDSPMFEGVKHRAKVKLTPATNQVTNVAAIPRALPQLAAYWLHDPPKGVFDIANLTLSGDMRVRPEFRTNSTFGAPTTPNTAFAPGQNDNAFFTQQWVRFGINYDLSPDVAFFLQPQVTNNFGAMPNPLNVPPFGNPLTSGNTLFMRQGFMLIRNFLIPDLTIKAGRQLMVWGDHRMFGHFDWNNIAFSHDGITMRYNHAQFPVEMGWLRHSEGNCMQNAGACLPTPGVTSTHGHRGDADLVFVRLPWTFGSFTMEPAWILQTGGPTTGAGTPVLQNAGAFISNQTRHTVGGRMNFKEGIFDFTAEGYWQFGEMGEVGQPSDIRINALAGAINTGITLPVPMQPRVGFEINYASGSGDQGFGGGTFQQLYPTNHIHFGYMDLMSWQNMLVYGANFQLRPTKDSHFEVWANWMRLASTQDNWYTASRGTFFATPEGNTAKNLGTEVDVSYTVFFQDNKVGWQITYGHFFTGDYLSRNGFGTNNQAWGYTQFWINF